MNKLLQELSKELKNVNLGVVCKKETNTLLHCYLYDLNDCVSNGIIYDYRNCKKLDIKYKKTDLYAIISNKNLKSFCSNERKAYDMANALGMLRQ